MKKKALIIGVVSLALFLAYASAKRIFKIDNERAKGDK